MPNKNTNNAFDDPGNWGKNQSTNIILTDNFLIDYYEASTAPTFHGLGYMAYYSSTYQGIFPQTIVQSQFYSDIKDCNLFSIDGNSIIAMSLLKNPQLFVLAYKDGSYDDKTVKPTLKPFAETPTSTQKFETQFNVNHLMSNKLLNISFSLDDVQPNDFPLAKSATITTSTDFQQGSASTHVDANSGTLRSNVAEIDKNVGLTVVVDLKETSPTLVTNFSKLIQTVEANFKAKNITLKQEPFFNLTPENSLTIHLKLRKITFEFTNSSDNGTYDSSQILSFLNGIKSDSSSVDEINGLYFGLIIDSNLNSGQSISDLMDYFTLFLGNVKAGSIFSSNDALTNSIGIGSILNDYNSANAWMLTSSIYTAHVPPPPSLKLKSKSLYVVTNSIGLNIKPVLNTPTWSYEDSIKLPTTKTFTGSPEVKDTIPPEFIWNGPVPVIYNGQNPHMSGGMYQYCAGTTCLLPFTNGQTTNWSGNSASPAFVFVKTNFLASVLSFYTTTGNKYPPNYFQCINLDTGHLSKPVCSGGGSLVCSLQSS